MKKWSQRALPEKYRAISNYGAAGIAFLLSSVIIVPGEFLKQQVQMAHFDTVGQAIVATLHSHAAAGDVVGSLSGFFAGFDGVLARDVPYTMLELGLYDQIKTVYAQTIANRNANNDPAGSSSSSSTTKPITIPLQPWEEIVAAAMTGGVAGYLTTPLDTIKTKLMVDTYDGGFVDCLLDTFQSHGLSALMAGGVARVCWLMPFTAIYLPLFDVLKRRLEDRGGDNDANDGAIENRTTDTGVARSDVPNTNANTNRR